MKWLLFVLLLGHGMIHLIGPASALHPTTANPFRHSITPVGGVLWTIAALLLIVAAAGVVRDAPWWWYPAVIGVPLSQALIIGAWGDAKFGTLANIIIAVPVLVAAFDVRASSFRSRFTRDSSLLLAAVAAAAAPDAVSVRESDLSRLPPLMQGYLRRAGAVGRAHVHTLRVTFRAQMRSSATAPWMHATATQFESFDRPARLFHMTATRAGVPMDVLHEYVDGAATFQVRIAGLIQVVDKHGPALTHDETVTLMNDVLVLAPAAVLNMAFDFVTLGDHTVRATFRNAGFTVTAILTFDDAGDLVGFTSADRSHSRDEGVATWSTPISGYRLVDGVRVGARGDANWIEPSGEWTYGRFEIATLAYNVAQ